jgi:hypothetical protein
MFLEGCVKNPKEGIQPDDMDKNCFEKQRMCRFCNKFAHSQIDKNLGKCMNKVIAYPDMIAKTCRDFTWKQ